MKKITLFLTLLIFTFGVNATIYLDETFNYDIGTLKPNWTAAGTIGSWSSDFMVDATALTYSNTGGIPFLSGVGKSLTCDYQSPYGATNYYNFRLFNSSPISTGTVYASFLYSPNGILNTQSNAPIFLMTGTSSTTGVSVYVGKALAPNDATHFRFGTTRGSSGSADIKWGTTEFSMEDNKSNVFFIVLKYDLATQISYLYINPVVGSATEPTAEASDATSTSSAKTSLQGIEVKTNGNTKTVYKISGIRVSTTWSEAVAAQSTAAPLATPIVGAASSITANGFTANWTPVSNAIGYDVMVYQGTTLVKTSNASGQSASSLEITGLTEGTSYTYKVIAKGNGTDFSNSDLSEASTAFSTLGTNSIDKFTTDFGDGTWGPIATTSYPSGSYPSSTINGFNLVKTYLYTGTVTCDTGEKHTNRILMGKSSEGAVIEFPALTTVGEVEIHAATGSDAMSFRLEELVGLNWEIIGTYTTRKSPDSIYVIPVLRNSVTKLRIANNTGSGLYVYKILTRTYQEATELTLRSSSPSQDEVCFANLKKTLTLTFNKNVEKVSGNILLNNVAIPLNLCTISQNIVSVPVELESIPGSNKNYTFTVSAGTFAETGNATNLSKAISISFQTLKSVVYPTNYTALMDINYKNVNSTNTRMDVYYPTNATTPVPVVINMHGGGWSGGFKEEQGGFSMYFNRGYAVVNVEYRLRGEALAPACVEDVRGALNYVLNHAQGWNIDVNKVIFQGGSAGGHLALMGGYLQNSRIYDNDCVQYPNPIKILAVIDKYGPCDFTQLMTYSSLIAWTGPRFSDQAFLNSLSPIEYVNASTPPTYIIHGDADPTIPYNQSVTLYAALQAAGVKSKFTTVPNGGHGGFTDSYNTQMENEILSFIDEVLANVLTGVDSQKTSSGINIKVTGNNILINSERDTKTIVYTALGKEILTTNSKTFEIKEKGLYILKVDNGENNSISKILIK